MRTALALTLVAALSLCGGYFAAALYAGTKACDPTEGAPCEMDSCDRMARGKQLCGPKCHKTCCKCPTECNGHQHDPPPDPEGGKPEMKDCTNRLKET